MMLNTLRRMGSERAAKPVASCVAFGLDSASSLSGEQQAMSLGMRRRVGVSCILIHINIYRGEPNVANSAGSKCAKP